MATIALAAGSVRYGWDLDNVTAPIVSTLGDVLTLPALWVASLLVVDFPAPADVLGAVVGAVASFGFVARLALAAGRAAPGRAGVARPSCSPPPA